jgi:thiamine-phosphate pyrophosphorylase
MIPPPPIVCVITRARGLPGSAERLALLARLKAAAAAGAAFIQVRERQLSDRALVAFVRELVECTRDRECRVLVNDRPDIALAAGAAGVHLKDRSLAAADVRRIVPAAFIVGRSVHSEGDATAAEAAGGCDYLLFGTVFPSASKPDDHPIAGIDALRRVCERVSLPVLAIGGINTGRAQSVAAAGAAGAAGISLFSEAPDIGAAVRALRAALTPPSGMSKVARNE